MEAKKGGNTGLRGAGGLPGLSGHLVLRNIKVTSLIGNGLPGENGKVGIPGKGGKNGSSFRREYCN